jgi:hypothetical protein
MDCSIVILVGAVGSSELVSVKTFTVQVVREMRGGLCATAERTQDDAYMGQCRQLAAWQDCKPT